MFCLIHHRNYKMSPKLIVLLLLMCVMTISCKHYTPIVLWHGIDDTCCDPEKIGKIKELLEEALPGAYVLSLQIGNSTSDDHFNSFVMHPDKQIEIACNIVSSDPLLVNGYNGIGFSQGSQFLRGLVQRCSSPAMKNLITMAGQHQGVYGVPSCDPIPIPRCDSLRQKVSKIYYLSLMQKRLASLTYWHNPLDEEEYKEKSTYIADINNEKIINQTYIKNLQRLENFVMVKYEKESVVIPSESSWFGFYKPGQSKEVYSLRESDLYKLDRLGLKQMDKDGKLRFLSAPWHHGDFDWFWFKANIVEKFLT